MKNALYKLWCTSRAKAKSNRKNQVISVIFELYLLVRHYYNVYKMCNIGLIHASNCMNVEDNTLMLKKHATWNFLHPLHPFTTIKCIFKHIWLAVNVIWINFYFCGVCGVGDDSSRLLFNETNLNYHHLRATYTTGVHAMYNIFEAH